jgi:hypothetical protein
MKAGEAMPAMEIMPSSPKFSSNSGKHAGLSSKNRVHRSIGPLTTPSFAASCLHLPARHKFRSGSPAITGFLIGFGMCEAGVVSFALNNHHVTHPAAIPNIAKNVPSIIDAFTLNFLSYVVGLLVLRRDGLRFPVAGYDQSACKPFSQYSSAEINVCSILLTNISAASGRA